MEELKALEDRVLKMEEMLINIKRGNKEIEDKQFTFKISYQILEDMMREVKNKIKEIWKR